MDLIRFNDLKPGQFVKISGKFRDGKGFLAVELTLEAAPEEAEFECPIQHFDCQRRQLRLCDRTIGLDEKLEIKNVDGELAGLEDLQPGRMIKVKGAYAEGAGFVPKKIKIKESLEFNIEQMQGNIGQIDRERKTLFVNGVKILLTPQTVIARGESFDGLRNASAAHVPI